MKSKALVLVLTFLIATAGVGFAQTLTKQRQQGSLNLKDNPAVEAAISGALAGAMAKMPKPTSEAEALKFLVNLSVFPGDIPQNIYERYPDIEPASMQGVMVNYKNKRYIISTEVCDLKQLRAERSIDQIATANLVYSSKDFEFCIFSVEEEEDKNFFNASNLEEGFLYSYRNVPAAAPLAMQAVDLKLAGSVENVQIRGKRIAERVGGLFRKNISLASAEIQDVKNSAGRVVGYTFLFSSGMQPESQLSFDGWTIGTPLLKDGKMVGLVTSSFREPAWWNFINGKAQDKLRILPASVIIKDLDANFRPK